MLVALVVATWLAIAGLVFLLWGTLLPGRHPGPLVSGAVSLGAAALIAVWAVRSRPR
jgi:hypothetical protein